MPVTRRNPHRISPRVARDVPRCVAVTTAPAAALAPIAFLLAAMLAATGCRNASGTRRDAASSAAPVTAIASAESSETTTPPAAPHKPVHADDTSPKRFVIVGGGPVPSSNEVSLEQDVAIVERALLGPGTVLFAGGSHSPTVREIAPGADPDPVRTALGGLFSPRPGRRSRYRAPRFAAESATTANVEAAISAALATGATPLLVYLTGHGDRGTDAADNSLALWGSGALSARGLAALHERHSRPLRLVATSCFSGGFGELAFAGADAKGARPAPVSRCGVFAGTDDRETSGCDPDPRRRAQESYGLHLTHVLSKKRKDGSPLPLADVDFDADGKIGLLDAHTYARIHAVSFDVPTTTSERWLRAVERGSAPIDKALGPEDAAVVDRLGSALGVPTEPAAKDQWRQIDERIAAINAQLDDAEDALDAHVLQATTQLLERWPILDDAYHAEFEATLTKNRAAIAAVLFESEAAKRRLASQRDVDRLYGELDAQIVAEARLLRVLRAYETLHKATALKRRGGPHQRTYAELLACERAPLE